MYVLSSEPGLPPAVRETALRYAALVLRVKRIGYSDAFSELPAAFRAQMVAQQELRDACDAAARAERAKDGAE